jgi:hypothetical protein
LTWSIFVRINDEKTTSSHSIAVAARLDIANMASAGRGAAKVLGINLDYRKEELDNSGAASISSVETCKLSSV